MEKISTCINIINQVISIDRNIINAGGRLGKKRTLEKNLIFFELN